MRLFVAINLPEGERQRIYEAAAPLRDAGMPFRWIPESNFHLTLKFLGEVRQETIPAIKKVLDKVTGSTRAFELDLSGFGAFPTIRRPRVMWLGVDPSPALRCLKQDLEWALADLGFDRETRAFHPHITLGRAEAEEGAGSFRGLDELAAGMVYAGEVPGDRVQLMRSHLSKNGARYSTLHESCLAEADKD